MPIKYLSKFPAVKLKEKTVLLRVDLNIKSDNIADAYRLEAIIPTLQFLKRAKAQIIVLSHRGRPGGSDPSLSLKPFASILSKKLKTKVVFRGSTSKWRSNLKSGEVILLENLRFDPREEANDKAFAKELASFGNIYVNDAFAVSHRANASVEAITKFLPSYAGLLLEQEIKHLDKTMKKYKKPLVLIVGGAKVEDKAGILKYFLQKADYILLGGGVANTFIRARGRDIKKSLFDDKTDITDLVNRKNIFIPEDDVWKNEMIVDIGPKTQARYAEIIAKAKTIVWGGPMGRFEERGLEEGTRAIWQAILKNKKTFAVVGGGETVGSISLIHNSRSVMRSKNIFISTGGGAMLEYLSGQKLPGIEALKKRKGL